MERVKQRFFVGFLFVCLFVLFVFFSDLTVERMPSACAVKIGRASPNFQIYFIKIHDSQKRISKTQHLLIVVLAHILMTC